MQISTLDEELDRRIERKLRQLGLLVPDAWLEPGLAARRANLSRGHLLRLIRQGRGPATAGTGKMLRIRTSAIDAWLESLQQVGSSYDA